MNLRFKTEYKSEVFLWFFIILSSVTILSVFINILVGATYKTHVSTLKDHARDTLSHLQFSASHLDRDKLQKYIEKLASQSDSYSYILIMDRNGIAIVHSQPSRVGMAFDEDGFRESIATGNTIEQIYVRDAGNPSSPYHGEKTIDILTPVYDSDGVIAGVANVGLSLKAIEALKTHYILISLLGVMIWIVLLIAYASLRFSQLRALNNIRKEKEEYLERLNLMIQNSSDILTVVDEKGTQLLIGGPLEQTTGYKPEELLGKVGFEFMHPDDIEPTLKVFAEALSLPGSVRTVKYRFRHKNGFYVPIECVGTNLLNHPVIKGVVLNVRDISEREKTEEALRLSEASLHSQEKTFANMISALPGVVYQFYARPDGSSGMYFVSDKSKEMLGMDPDDPDFVTNITMSIVPEDRQRFIDSIADVVQNGSEWRYEGRRIRQTDGLLQWFSGHSVPMRVGDELIFTGFLLDITDRKLAQMELLESQEKFAQVFNLSPDMIGITRLSDGTILEGNLAFSKLTGYSREEFLGRTVLDLGLYRYPETGLHIMELIYRDGELQNFDLEMRLKSGEIRNCLLSVKPLVLKGENCLSFVIHDITERKQAELTIKQLNESLQKKLVALTKPVGDISNLELSELFNIEDIQQIQDAFALATGVASIITTPDGVPITKPSNFCHLCENVIRKTEKGLMNCYHSDAILGSTSDMNGPRIQHCLSGGLWDAGTSIYVGDRHIANWLIGQVLEEPFDEEKMIQYAHEIGADEDNFRAALKKVTRMPLEQFKLVCQFLYSMADQLSRLALQNVQQARFITERNAAVDALKENEEIFNQLMEHSPIHIFFKDENIRSLKLSRNFETLVGKPIDEMLGKSMYELFPSDFAEKMVADDMRILSEGRNVVVEEEFAGKFYSTTKFPIYCEGKAARLAGFTIDITEQKLAEAALKKSEELFRNTFENHSAVMMLIDPETGSIIKANQAASNYYGWSCDKLAMMNIMDINTMSPQEIRAEMARAREQNKNQFEFLHRRADGSIRDVAVFSSKISSEGRDFLYSIVQDITERKQAEKELMAKTEELNRYFTSSLDLLCIADTGGHFIRLNPEWEKVLGYKIHELLGREFIELVHPDDRKKTLAAIITLSGQEEVLSFENRYRCKDGSYRWIEWRSHPDGELIYAIARDITERVKAEEELAENEAKFHAIYDQAVHLAAILDMDGTVLDVNTAARNFIGNPDSSLYIGKSFWETPWWTHSPEIQQQLKDAIQKAASGQYCQWETTHINAEGQVRYIDVSLKPVMDADGNIFCLIPEGRDITERKLAEKEQEKLHLQLQQAQKMESIGRLAGGVAHDFNNLLTSISGNVELAMSEIPRESSLSVSLSEVRKASISAAALIKQLLAFSRKQIIEPRVIDLNVLISNMHKMLVRLIGEDIELKTITQEGIKAVKIDPSQFEQIIINLSVNARDAMPEGGVLTVETAMRELDDEYCRIHTDVIPGQYVLLAVSDTGCGMSAETMQNIFEPFFTTKPKSEGTGLGLATTYGAVKQAGGNIEVYSEVGKGTTFKIYLPAVEEKAYNTESEHTSEVLCRGSETVLLVEDEEMVRNLAVRLLKKMGYNVIEAPNGMAAVETASQMKERIDLLMTDVVMPGMNGRQLAGHIKELHPETRILYTSGYTENIIAHHGVVEDGLNFIGKPYSMNMLAKKLREVLDGKETS